MVAISVSEARAKLPYILKLVDAGDEVALTRHGKEVAVVVRPDTLRARRASPALELAAEVRNRLQAAREAPLPAEGLSSSSAEALAADIRAGRDSR